MSTPVYFWSKENKEIVVANIRDAIKLHRETWCVDTNDDDPKYRYGMWDKYGDWVHGSWEALPPEFKVHLLLLGVS